MATKNALESAAQLADDWSKIVIPLTNGMDARDETWQTDMPKKVYAAIRNLWLERRSFLDLVAVEIREMRSQKQRAKK